MQKSRYESVKYDWGSDVRVWTHPLQMVNSANQCPNKTPLWRDSKRDKNPDINNKPGYYRPQDRR